MSEMRLFDVPAVPILTPRQQRAYDAIVAAGFDGLYTDELGAVLHPHDDDERCDFCGSSGQEVGKALRAKGLVQQRRRKAAGGDSVLVWTVAGRLDKPRVVRPGEGIPF